MHLGAPPAVGSYRTLNHLPHTLLAFSQASAFCSYSFWFSPGANKATGGAGFRGAWRDGWGAAIADLFDVTATVKDTAITGSLTLRDTGDTGAYGRGIAGGPCEPRQMVAIFLPMAYRGTGSPK
jgi:hypothetical protein